FCAAAGPRTLRITGQLADGTILDSGGTVERVRAARQVIDEARADAGRTGAHPVVLYLLTVTGPDAARRLEAMGRAGTAAVAGGARAGAGAGRFWGGGGPALPPWRGTPARSRRPSVSGRRPGRIRSCSTRPPTTPTRSPSSGSRP